MPASDFAAIESDWRALESLGPTTFFQSWDWIGSLLESVPEGCVPQVLRVSDMSGRLAGMCLLWSAVHRRRGFVRSRGLHLNETGDKALDRLTMEHNGAISAPGRKAAVAAGLVAHLAKQPDWDELHLGGIGAIDRAAWKGASSSGGLLCREHWVKPTFYVNLERLRADKTPYLSALSSNTRYQARRAMKRCAEAGALRYEVASSLEEAMQWLRSLAELHQAQWTSRGEVGAFGSPFAVRFHEHLVARGWPGGRVIVARVSAGTAVLGYLYNFARDGVIYNYQSGHIASDDAHAKPGLVCHCLAVEDALQRQFRIYDMLMGGGHFKASLTNGTDPLYWVTLQRKRLRLRLESLLRTGRNLVVARLARAEKPDANSGSAGKRSDKPRSDA